MHESEKWKWICSAVSDYSRPHALEKEMATHSSVLAWRIPGTGEPDGLPSMGLHSVRHDWSDLAAAAATLLIIFKMLRFPLKITYNTKSQKDLKLNEENQ